MFDESYWAEPLLHFLYAFQATGPGKRGKAYAVKGHVLNMRLEGDDTFYADVEGTDDEPYTVALGIEEGVLGTDCSCPYGIDCKHGYAAALVLVGEAYRRGADWTQHVEELLPPSWLKGQWPALTLLRQNMSEIFGDEGSVSVSEPRSSESLPKLTEPSPEWWRAYVEAPTTTQQQEILRRALKHYVPPSYGSWALDDLLSRSWQITNPFDRLRRLEEDLLQLSHNYGRRDLTPDPALEAFLKSDEAREMEQAYHQRQSETALLTWLREKAPSSADDRSYVEVVWSIGPPAAHRVLPQLGFQVLLTTKKLRSSPRSPQGLEQLCREVESGRRYVDPMEARLLRWVLRSHQLQQGPVRGDSTFLPVRNALEWITLWGPHALLRWEDGLPLVFEPEPARISIQERDEGAAWSVVFPGEQNETVLLPDARICSDRGTNDTYWNQQDETRQVFVRQGNVLRLFESGGMPDEVLAGAIRVPEVPVRLLRGTPEGARLVKRLAPRTPQEGADGLMAAVPVRPVVECRLEGNTLVHLSARAEGPGDIQFIWTHLGSWEYQGKSSTPFSELERMSEDIPEAFSETPAELQRALTFVPRAEDVVALNAWLSFAGRNAKFVTTPQGGAGLEWRIRGAAVYELLDLWAKRPQGVTYLGDRAFRSLVTPGAAPAIRVQAEPSGTDWLKVSIDMEKEIAALSLDEIAAALQGTENELVYLTGGRLYRREDLEAFRRQAEALEEMGVELHSGEQRVHAMQIAGARSEALSELMDASGQLEELARRARETVKNFKGVPKAKIPKITADFLRSYQKTGVDFLVWSARTFGGAVLADDMGLGKTLQVLAALSTLKAAEKKHAPSLVVCPASVAHNWKREAARFAPNLRVVIIERGVDRKQILDHLEDFDLVIKNYALTRREAETLREREWLAVCVDEAQAIKNPGADITRTVKSLPSKYRFTLTGTPIENRLTDLWSIVDFTLPGYLHSLSRFEKRLRAKDTQAFQRVIRARLRPVLLRRTKAEVAPELPPRIEERRDCEMSASQRKVYITEVQKTRLLLDGLDPTGRKAAQGRIKMLAALTRLRQICCDPALVGLPDMGSGKVDQLLELLPPILEQGHKVLLFSQFVRMLKRLEKTLATHKIPTRILTGETTSRQELVDAFEADPEPSVFLISLKAGGVGLNLPSASYVILFDPWWNPAVEAQAIDRTHRIGQDKTVLAFRLVSTGTVEERILELQERKRSLVTEILEEEAFNRTLSKEDFAYLLESDL